MAAAIPAKVGKIVDVFVSIAAAIVIWGALRKILHSPDADMWLKIGLTTEALVFLVYGILYLKYPAVDDHAHAAPAAAPGARSGGDRRRAGRGVEQADRHPGAAAAARARA